MLEASLAARQAAHEEMSQGLNDCLRSADHAIPVRGMVGRLDQQGLAGISAARSMLGRAKEIRGTVRDIGHDPAAHDLKDLQAVAHELLQVLHHRPVSAPPRHIGDTLDDMVAFLDPHEAGHADEDRLGILAEAHVSALAVRGGGFPWPGPSDGVSSSGSGVSADPFLRGAHLASPTPRNSEIPRRSQIGIAV